jgi:hypothetical protein
MVAGALFTPFVPAKVQKVDITGSALNINRSIGQQNYSGEDITQSMKQNDNTDKITDSTSIKLECTLTSSVIKSEDALVISSINNDSVSASSVIKLEGSAVISVINNEVAPTSSVINNEDEQTSSLTNRCMATMQLMGLMHLKSLTFFTFVMVSSVNFNCGYCVLIYTSGLVKENGIDEKGIAIILSIMSGAGMLGKLFAASVCDIAALNKYRTPMYGFFTILNGVAITLTAAFASNYQSMALALSIYFFTSCVPYSQFSVVMVDITSRAQMPSAFGLIRFVNGIVVFGGIRLAGKAIF